MTTISETGYAKLIANLRIIIAAAIRFAEKYNPFKDLLKVAALEKLAAEGETALQNVSLAYAEYKKALDEREQLFDMLGNLVTRVMNALKASASTESFDEAARSIVRKIRGSKSPRRKESVENTTETAEDTGKERSVSQMSYDNRISHLQDLINLVAGIQVYQPNETELQVESLRKLKDELLSKNSAVVTAHVALKEARAARNDVMFRPNTGIVDVALDAKSYIKSLFGSTSEQYKQVSGLKFK